MAKELLYTLEECAPSVFHVSLSLVCLKNVSSAKAEFILICTLAVHSCADFKWFSSFRLQFQTWLSHSLTSWQLFWSLKTSLNTSFLLRVFEIFLFIPLMGLFCTPWLSLSFLMILLTPVDDTWKQCHNFAYPSHPLWASTTLFLKLTDLFCCCHDAFSGVSSNLCWSIYTVCKLEDRPQFSFYFTSFGQR